MVHVARLNLGPPLPDRKGNGKPHQTAHVLSFLPLEGTVNSGALLPLAERDASSSAAADRDELHRGGGGWGTGLPPRWRLMSLLMTLFTSSARDQCPQTANSTLAVVRPMRDRVPVNCEGASRFAFV